MTFSNFLDKVFNNWQAKLISFGLALLLYFGFQITSIQTKNLSVPITIQETGNYILMGNAPSVIRIEISGNEDEIDSLHEEDFYAYIDTSLVTKTGITRLPVRLNLENEAAISETLDVQIFPDTVELEFEEKTAKWVPIIPLFKGIPEEGYHQVSWKCTPSDIKITGPKTITEETNFVYADSVNLNKKTTGFITEVEPTVQNKRLSLVKDEPFMVDIEIEPKIINKIFEISIPLSSLSREFTVAQPIQSVKVELSGEMNYLNQYTPDENNIEIDFSEIGKPGTYTIPFTVRILELYSVESIDVSEITVEIIETPEVELNSTLNTNNLIQDLISQEDE